MKIYHTIPVLLGLLHNSTGAWSLRRGGPAPSNRTTTRSLLDFPVVESSVVHPKTPKDDPDFVPLSCNGDIEQQSCRKWTALFGTAAVQDDRVVINCGECVWLDAHNLDRDGGSSDATLTLRGGLDVRGKLIIPNPADENVQLTLRTKMFVVQGELDMDVSSKAVVDGTPPVKLLLIGDRDEFFEPAEDNALNCFDGQLCNAGKKGFVVAGGKISIHGLPPGTPTWVNLYDVTMFEGNFPKGIILESSVCDKWAPGAEILITSHSRQWDDHQVRTIKLMTTSGDSCLLELNNPIKRPTTLRDSQDFAVEVALLSRNIVFEGGPDAENDKHGGHLWVMNTPGVPQTLEGVEFVNFGQQGVLGRYPIHFHFCGDSTDSIVAKNTIRQSQQRCVVVHGTDNLRIEENIAFDTKGHCFMLEDGMETGNMFIRNLGAYTRIPETSIPNFGHNGKETDYDPATFWVTNPSNIWYGNVAAGSESSGFWFELLLRGTRAKLYGNFDPKSEPLTLFENNIVHSCEGRAVRTYPSGYLPDKEADMLGLKVYRNADTGVFFHITRNVLVKGGLLADNRVGIDVDRADDIRIRNTEIIGRSNVYEKLATDTGSGISVPRFCTLESKAIGLQLHTWKDNPEEDGVTVMNVDFSGFANSICPEDTVPVSMDDTTKTGGFDLYSTFQGITFEKRVDPIDFCKADSAKVVDVYLTDLDGSFHSESQGLPSTLVSNRRGMLNFADRTKCTQYDDRCYSYCTDTCFRSIRYEVDPAGTEDFKLKVCKRDTFDTDCILIPGYHRSDDGRKSTRLRTFRAHLPIGDYVAVFLDRQGHESWPSFVREYLEEEICPSADSHSVELLTPNPGPEECTELIKNGNAEDSLSEPAHWLFRFGGIDLSQRRGVDGSNALTGGGMQSRITLVQYIDTRCLKLMKGQRYKVKAEFKLLREDGRFKCDPEKNECPGIGIRCGEGQFLRIAEAGTENRSPGFQFAEGVVRIDSDIADCDEAIFFIDSELKDTELYVDNVSMKLLSTPSPTGTRMMTETPAPTISPTPAPTIDNCKNLILNSVLDEGFAGYWTRAGGGTLSNTEDGGVGSSPALVYSNRQFPWNGPAYKAQEHMDYSCLTPGSSWQISAQVKLVDENTGAGASCETSTTCPKFRILIIDTGGNYLVWEKIREYASDAWDPVGFNLLQVEIQLPEEDEWDGPIQQVFFDIRDYPWGTTLIVDDVTWGPLDL